MVLDLVQWKFNPATLDDNSVTQGLKVLVVQNYLLQLLKQLQDVHVQYDLKLSGKFYSSKW